MNKISNIKISFLAGLKIFVKVIVQQFNLIINMEKTWFTQIKGTGDRVIDSKRVKQFRLKKINYG
jgi:hypothetical protein